MATIKVELQDDQLDKIIVEDLTIQLSAIEDSEVESAIRLVIEHYSI